MKLWNRTTDDARLALRVEGGYVWVEIHSSELKSPLSFHAGNFDYVMQRGEPFFIGHPHLVPRVRTMIERARNEALRSLPSHVWEPVVLDARDLPPLIDRMLFFFLSKEDAVAFPGDHVEVFEKSAQILGPRGARWWYLKELAWMAFDTTLCRLTRIVRLLCGSGD